MFSFFTRKEYLVDHLNGFIDIHNHILPGIDDGAKNVEESIQLVKGFREFGVNKFICTPHIMHNYYDNTQNTIKKSFKKLKKALKENNIEDAKINYAAEHMIDANFEYIFNENKVLLINKNHLLIEMSYLQNSINFEASVRQIVKKQIHPILAHPERYMYLHKDLNNYRKIREKGVVFQLNMLSLSDYYGKEIRKIAIKLLDNDMYTFIGSDVHNLKHLNHLKESVVIDKKRLDKILELINNTIFSFG